MRVVPRGVEPVGEWKTEVVFVEFDESGPKLGGVVEFLGKRIRLELKASTERGHGKGEQLKDILYTNWRDEIKDLMDEK